MEEDLIKIPDVIKKAWQAVSGHRYAGDVVSAAVLCPIATKKRADKAAVLKNMKPGDLIPDEGVFVGRYRVVYPVGKSLVKIFNIYAAPEDLTDVWDQPSLWSYSEAINRLLQIEDWHGHHGCFYRNDQQFYAALKYERYDGGWIIPPLDILSGLSGEAGKLGIDNLRAHKDDGCFKGTFGRRDMSAWYLSCTEVPGSPHYIRSAHFVVKDSAGYANKREGQMSCRLVRLVLLEKVG